jgi:hypothetical protein
VEVVQDRGVGKPPVGIEIPDQPGVPNGPAGQAHESSTVDRDDPVKALSHCGS